MQQCKWMAEATLSAKNQIVIPLEAREALGLKPGDKVLVVVRGRSVLILRKPKSYHAAIRGLGRGAYSKTYLQNERLSWK
jgi:AbrB family looped-hinge helix DNA binding protein